MSIEKGSKTTGARPPMMIRCDADVQKRFRIASVEEGLTHGQMLAMLLDERDAKLRRRKAQQAHPLAIR